ncbi:MAG TPA: hypothetical protein VK209_11665 [Candidatus Sulfotelmatobacter sp.]|nr:hypothetical protein [Candidatus Sulfotelmatobacter sp.]
MPTFLTKKQVYEWIKRGDKTIDLRRGKQLKGNTIVFMGGGRQFVRGTIVRKQEGKLQELLNEDTYKKIVPIAKNKDEALVFIKQIYPLTDEVFTAYEFQLNKE